MKIHLFLKFSEFSKKLFLLFFDNFFVVPEGEVTPRSLDDVRALREPLVGARDVAVAGGGILGMEVAASAVALGKSVTVVDRVRPLLDRLGPVLSDIVLTAAVIRFQYIGAPALLFGFGRSVTYRARAGRFGHHAQSLGSWLCAHGAPTFGTMTWSHV